MLYMFNFLYPHELEKYAALEKHTKAFVKSASTAFYRLNKGPKLYYFCSFFFYCDKAIKLVNDPR